MVSDCGRCGKGVNHLDHSRGVCSFLKVGKQPKQAKPIAPRSEKMAEFYRTERRATIEFVIARDGGQCQIVSPWHARVSDWNPITVHEIRTRGREGGIMAEGVNDPANCVAACLLCNRAVSENPEWAESKGWLLPASPVRNE